MDKSLFFRKNYLDCIKIEIAYQMFSHAGDETNHLFFNAYETHDRILEKVLAKGINFWEYCTKCFNLQDIQRVGVEIVEKRFSSQVEVEHFIRNQLYDRKIIFFATKAKYIPGLERMEPDNAHSIMIEEFSEINKDYRLNDIMNFQEKWVSGEFLLDVLGKMNQVIYALDFNKIEFTSNEKSFFLQKSKKLIQQVKAESTLFDTCIEIINTSFNSPSNEISDTSMSSLRQVFYIIAGSRYYYSKFLQIHNYPKYLCDLLVHCSDLAEVIKDLLIKGDMIVEQEHKFKIFSRAIEQINILKKFENAALMLLKWELLQCYDGNVEQLINNKNIPNPANLILVYITDHSLKIAWDPEYDSQFVLSYEIHIDDRVYTSKNNNIQISGLKGSTEYDITVISKGILGDLSKPGTKLNVITKSREDQLNLALYRPVRASSTEANGFDIYYHPHHVVDGDKTTRWSSNFSEPQWIVVDLEREYDIQKTIIRWEEAYAVQYEIQTSKDNLAWETIFSNDNGKGGLETINCIGSGRYVRILLLKRSTLWGFSIWNIGIHGKERNRLNNNT